MDSRDKGEGIISRCFILTFFFTQVVWDIVASGCQAVPKSDQSNDQFCWRLSFSRGEGILSHHVPEKARLAFLAIKLAWKQKLKPVCENLKSYHLKTIFYHFLEKTSTEFLENAEVAIIFKYLIAFMNNYIETGQIPHIFIRNVNLLEKSPLTRTEKSICVSFFQELRRQKMESVFCRGSRMQMKIQEFHDQHPYLTIIVAIILIILNIAGVFAGAAVYLAGFLLFFSLQVCFLYSCVISIPIFIVIIIIHTCIRLLNRKN